ncbi:LOW QUALITY PROTEIN: uncharacterized protein LOC121347925 [Onychostruthus taczanowskii]|uniref:LOW QUALITY PROTEIN: uncharacterized protein LOC121347925 n=1 Tax=Onychostruthus taczanowskii TaxID=356909 RepID=UPI001B802E00|nr:LOW QUALITY PROTEIN: uncharacterized protein LOC121347925 [Onychostruthus taczanowskii]
MRRCRGAGLAALAALLLVAVARAQVQQEPSLQTTEGIGINITCSHPKRRLGETIYWYQQLLDKGPELLAFTARGSKAVPAIAGQVTVSEDGRSSPLWLGRPRRGDAAVYYCALGARAEEPGLRPGTNRRGRGRPGPAGGAAAPPPGLPGLRSSFLCPEPARTGTAQPRTAPAPLTTRLQLRCTLATHSPASPRSPARLCPAPNCCGLRLCRRLSPSGLGCCCSQPASRSKEMLLDSTGLGADQATALTGTQGLIHGVLSHQEFMT